MAELELASKEFVDDNSGRKYYYVGYTNTTNSWKAVGRETAALANYGNIFFDTVSVRLPAGVYHLDSYILPYIELQGFKPPTKEAPLYLCPYNSRVTPGEAIDPIWYCKMESNSVKNALFKYNGYDYDIVAGGEFNTIIAGASATTSSHGYTCLCAMDDDGEFVVIDQIPMAPPSTKTPWVKVYVGNTDLVCSWDISMPPAFYATYQKNRKTNYACAILRLYKD